MKVQTDNNSREFKPVSMTITFETQKELDDLGTLFNLCCICDTIEVPNYLSFEELGGDTDNTSELLAKIKKHPNFK